MNYFEEIDIWLSTIILGGEEDEDEEQWFSRIKKQIKDKILESYRNGQKAGLEPKKPLAKELGRVSREHRFWPPRRKEER